MADSENKKSWSGWTRDAAMFTAGAVCGSLTTIAVGAQMEAIRTPEEREAAQKAKAAAEKK
jgi:hypothetical protein